MDTTNCSRFYATDIGFEGNPVGNCESSVIAFAAFLGIVMPIRLVAAILKWVNYCTRRKKHLQASMVGPTLHILTAIGYTLTGSLYLTNVINVYNGLSFSIYTLSYSFFSLAYFLSFYRLVRLGARFIKIDHPLGNNASSLEKLDGFGAFFVTIAILGWLASVIVLIILPPIVPTRDAIFGPIGWAAKGTVQACCALGMVWQMQRTYRLVDEKVAENSRKRPILRKLRKNQLTNIIFGLGVALFFLLISARLFRWYWWVVFGIPSACETIAAVLVEFRPNRTRPNEPVVHKQDKPSSTLHWLSSVYLPRRNPAVDDDEETSIPAPHATHGISNNVRELGHDTLLYYIRGKKFALQVAEATEHPALVFSVCLSTIAATALVLCQITLVEECVSTIFVFTWLTMVVFFLLCLLASRLSLSTGWLLLGTSAFWVRFFMTMVLFISLLDVVAFDERSYAVTFILILTAVGLLSDGFVKNSEMVRRTLYALIAPLPLILLILLQFDLINRRRDTKVPIVQIESFNYQWSVYQVALDAAYSLTFTFGRDTFRGFRARGHNFFLYLTAPVTIRVCRMGENSNDEGVQANVNAGIVIKDGTLILGDSGYIDRLIVHEEDSIVFRLFGKGVAQRFIKLTSKLWYRSLMRLLGAISMLWFACFVMPGLVAPEFVLVCLIGYIPMTNVAMIRGWSIMKLLMYRSDFVFDCTLVLLVIIAACSVLNDIRMLGILMLYTKFIDERLIDSRVVFFHSNTHGQKTQCTKFWLIIYEASVVLLMMSFAAVPIVFSFGFVANANPNAVLVFRNISSDSAQEPPAGTYAELKMIQFAASGIAASALYQISEQLISACRKRGSGVNLRWLQGKFR
jgi:hypothetical protein